MPVKPCRDSFTNQVAFAIAATADSHRALALNDDLLARYDTDLPSRMAVNKRASRNIRK
ncbi:MAG: hypothetical protein ACYC26_04650 [Phycisphaerales bacterium]